MMKQHVRSSRRCSYSDPFPYVPPSCFYYVCVFVKDVQPEAENHRLDMFRSVGAQCAVFCDCMRSNPLIVSGRRNVNARQCMTEGCNSREKYCCSNFGCRTRVCENCFNNMSRDGESVTLQPPTGADDVDSMIGASFGEDDDEGEGIDEDKAQSFVEEEVDDDDANEDCLDSDEYSDAEECVDVDDDCISSFSDQWKEDDRDNPFEDSEVDRSGEDSSYDSEINFTGADISVEVGEGDDPFEDYVSICDLLFLALAYLPSSYRCLLSCCLKL